MKPRALIPILLASPALAGAPAWSDGGTGGVSGSVRALAAVEHTGPVHRGLYVGGSFSHAGMVAASNIARWTGSAWATLGSGLSGEARIIHLHDPDGAGAIPPMLIVGGAFTAAGGAPAARIAAWNGSSWSPLGAGMNAVVSALATFDLDGGGPAPPRLFAGGAFTSAGGGPAAFIASWDGAAWSAAGDASSEVLALRVVIAGGTPQLAAGGWFTSIGGAPASRIATFDGAAWTPLDSGLGGPFPTIAQSIAEFGTLYVGGFFTSAGPIKSHGLARWDGAAWSAVQTGIGHPAEARTMLVHDDDGHGPNAARLFVAGNYVPNIGGPGNNIAAWDGDAWHTLGIGTDMGVWSLAAFDEDGDGPDPAALFVGGEFTSAGGVSALRLARWGTPRTTPPDCPDANLDGSVSFADITAVLANFNASCAGSPCPGDANHDLTVSFADITAVLSSWGMACP